MISFSFKCYGHPNIASKHRSTIEFTTDSNLTPRGDCILGVKTTTNLKQLPTEIKDLIRKKNSKIKVIMKIDEFLEEIEGEGHAELSLTDETAIIIRTSNYVCPKTLVINANKAAKDISSEMRELMRNPSTIMEITIQVESGKIETSKHA